MLNELIRLTVEIHKVAEGIEVPSASGFTDSLKRLARSVLDEGPPKWSQRDCNNSRYLITDLVGDLQAPRSTYEMQATATPLYPVLANHYLRSRTRWSGKAKAIPRRLHTVDSGFAQRFLESFESLFTENCSEKVIKLAAEILETEGGFLFEGHKLEAPDSWRIG